MASFALWMTIANALTDNIRPNIVLLFPDQWRFDFTNHESLNLSLRTPIFDDIVKNGTRFAHTIVASPLCTPSRACIASGKEYDYAGVPSNAYDFPQNQSTIYNLMRDNGYWVMVTGKDDLTKHHQGQCGIDGTYRQKELGFNAQRRCAGKKGALATYPNITDPYALYLQQHYNMFNGKNQSQLSIVYQCVKLKKCCNKHACPVPIPLHHGGYQDNYITDQTLALLDEAPANKPWFLQVNYAGPHPPFVITKAMNQSVRNRQFPHPMHSTKDEHEMLLTRRDYVAQIENLDTEFGKVIDKIRALGQYENTLFCVSSDHGEMLGDFDAWNKFKPWAASTNVPFACMGPGVKRNRVIYKYVTNMDIAGTFLDYTKTKVNADMSTVSLRPFLSGTWSDDQNEYRSHVSSGLSNSAKLRWRMVVQDVNASVTWKYICCVDKCPNRDFNEYADDGFTQLLFNVAHDLYEINNVGELYPDVMDKLRLLLPFNFCSNNSVTMVEEGEIIVENTRKYLNMHVTVGIFSTEAVAMGLLLCVMIYIFYMRFCTKRC